MSRFPILLLATAALAGCTVGPDYHRPVAPGTSAKAGWVEPAATGAIDPLWWRQFGDPQLTILIERALATAPDAKAAAARVREARANRAAAQGGALPSVNASGSYSRNRISENGQFPINSIPGFSRDFPLFDAGFDASWEVDLWGRETRTIQGARAREEAAEASRRDVLVTLSAEIARNYLDLRAAQADEASLRADAKTDAELARLTRLRFDSGEASRLDADSADSTARSSAAALANAGADVAGDAYRIAALVGAAPEEIAPQLRAFAPQPISPDSILVGVRSELLERRPDVRNAERQLAAASADIGVAKADFFPRFSLMGSIGQQAQEAGDLTKAGSTRFQFGPSFSWPIFAAGRIRAQVRAAGARADVAAADYDKAVVGALADSETAINRFLAARQALLDAEAALASQDNVWQLAQQRVDRGEDDRLALMRAAKTHAAAQRAAIAARQAKAQAAVALFKALGGSWAPEGEAKPTG